MELRAILAELGLPPGAPPVLSLAGGGTVVIDERPAEDAVYLRMPLGTPRLDRAGTIALYRACLAAGLLGQRTGGAVFAIDPEENMIELQRRIPLARLTRTSDLTDRLAELVAAAGALAPELGLTLDTVADEEDDEAA